MKVCILAAVTAIGLSAAPALAQYPEEPIVVAVQSGPGGLVEIGVRTAAPSLERCLGNNASIVVLNKPGANGDVAYSYLAQAAPDGYTLGIVNVPGIIANSLAQPRDYDPEEFVYLGSLTGGNVTISVLRDSPWNTLEELFEHIRQSGKPMPISSGGIGSSEHLALLQIERANPGVRFTVVPFNDAAAGMNALLGGHVEVTASSGAEKFQDRVRTLAIASPERIEELPETPTLKELGMDITAGSNHLYAGPPGLPPEIASKLAECIAAAQTDPEYLELAKERAFPSILRNAEETAAFVRQQNETLGKIWAETRWISN